MPFQDTLISLNSEPVYVAMLYLEHPAMQNFRKFKSWQV